MLNISKDRPLNMLEIADYDAPLKPISLSCILRITFHVKWSKLLQAQYNFGTFSGFGGFYKKIACFKLII